MRGKGSPDWRTGVIGGVKGSEERETPVSPLYRG